MKVKVLFVRSGNKGQHPITQNQGDSLVGVGCDVVYFDVVGKGLLGYLKNISPLRRVIKEVNPDVIHAHYSLCGFLSVLTFFNGPLVVSLMGSDVLTSSFGYRLLLKFFGRYFWSKVIVKSEEMYHQLGLKTASILPNGVSAKDYKVMDKLEARAQLGWPSDVKIALFASNPERKEKNYALFQKSITLLGQEGCNVIEKHLCNLNKEEMKLYYNASDVLVLTSFHEGSPNVIKEAMFCNCPFVSVPVGDVDYWIKVTKGNFLVNYDEGEIAMALKLAMRKEHHVDNKVARDELDAQRIAQKLKSMYIGLL